MVPKSGLTRYRVGDRVAETDAYRLYVCTDVQTGRQLMLQIATEVTHNGGLDRATYVLRELKKTADQFEAEHAKTGLGGLLSYERLFPLVVDSFVSEEQGKRRVTILAFNEVEDVTTMVPLSNILTKDHLRVELRSSAWIMGRLLKLLDFVHGEGITVRSLSGSNILLEPSQHFAVVFDWSSAQMHQAKIPAEDRKRDIASAAKAVFVAIGGDPRTGSFPYETDDEDDHRYVEFIWNLVRRPQSDAEKIHEQFYVLIDELYGRKFRPFATLSL